MKIRNILTEADKDDFMAQLRKMRDAEVAKKKADDEEDEWSKALASRGYNPNSKRRGVGRRSDRVSPRTGQATRDRKDAANAQGQHTSVEWFTPEELGISQSQFDAIKQERSTFQDVEAKFRHNVTAWEIMLDVLIGKGKKAAQKSYSNIELDAENPEVGELMKSVGLLNNRGGVTNRTRSYLQMVLKPNVGSDLGGYPARYSIDTIKTIEGPQGNFPPGVFGEMSRTSWRDSKKPRAQVKSEMLGKVKEALYGVEMRLKDRERKR